MRDLPRIEGVCTHDGFFSSAQVSQGPHISNCTHIGPIPKSVVHASNAKKVPLIVTGCARRIAGRLANGTIDFIDNLIDAAGAHQLAPSVLIFHDDPTDNATLGVLQQWAMRERRVRLVLSDMGDRGERIQRLALCRNVLRAEATARLKGGAGYVVSIDLDCRHGYPDALLRAVDSMRAAETAEASGGARNSPSSWDVLTANNVGGYRDMWALRASKMTMDYDCFWDFTQMRRRGTCKKYRVFVHPQAAPFAVESAFNGMAIFNARSLTEPSAAACRFVNETLDPDSKKTHVVSEHVPYHQCLVARGIRFGLLPSLLTYCHDWSTRHDAKRVYILRNGSVNVLTNRHVKPDKAWTALDDSRHPRP